MHYGWYGTSTMGRNCLSYKTIKKYRIVGSCSTNAITGSSWELQKTVCKKEKSRLTLKINLTTLWAYPKSKDKIVYFKCD